MVAVTPQTKVYVPVFSHSVANKDLSGNFLSIDHTTNQTVVKI